MIFSFIFCCLLLSELTDQSYVYIMRTLGDSLTVVYITQVPQDVQQRAKSPTISYQPFMMNSSSIPSLVESFSDDMGDHHELSVGERSRGIQGRDEETKA